MRAAPILLGVGLAVLVVLLTVRRTEAKPASETIWTESMASWLDNLTQDASANEEKYRPVIADAEARHDLPAGLLARLIYQESRYRSDIISGQVRSGAGAVGIAQIVPKWHPDVNPLDPVASIYYAAGYLRRLYNQFGDWRLALAAYNWGPGNQSMDLRDGIIGNEWPAETVAYVEQISRDVGLA